MHIVFHAGAHATDGDRLLKALLNNRDLLSQRATEVVTPNRFRSLIEEALMSLQGGEATPEIEEILLDALVERDDARRVILSSPALLSPPTQGVTTRGLYANAGARLAALAHLFPSAEVEIFIGLKNPAMLLRVLMAQSSRDGYEAFMQGREPIDLSWGEAMRDIVSSLQGRHRLVVWCHEDVPLIWPEILRLVGDLPPDAPLKDTLIYVQELVGAKGIEALRREMAGRDQLSIAARRALHADFIARHALPDKLEEVVEFPGWTQELVDQITAQYHADVGEIAVLPGVEFIIP